VSETAGAYVYALVPASFPVAPLPPGIDGRRLTVVRGGPVSAVVHEYGGEPYSGDDDTTRRRVLEHNDVVDRLWQRDRAVLPMTFDVIVAGTEESTAAARLEQWLRGSADEILAGLAAVAGRVELRVDLFLPITPVAASDPEVGLLRSRIESASPGLGRLLSRQLSQLERDVAERVADRIHADARPRLARWSADLRDDAARSPGAEEVPVLSCSLLVEEPAVPRIGEELAVLARSWPLVRVVFLGPWPPYSFARLRPASHEDDGGRPSRPSPGAAPTPPVPSEG
jgi:hypothetical protein